MLGAAVPLAGEEDGWLFTGLITPDRPGWVADHAVMETVLLPGTGFVELALAAGERVGASHVEELTIQAPLMVEREGAQLQLTLTAPGEDGRRELSIYSRADDPDDPADWVCHATATLSDAAGEQPEPILAWPPADAEELDIEFLYDRLAENGYRYGPAFQGLRRVWRSGEDVYAEVALPEEQATAATSYGLHPALLDATLHALIAVALEQGTSSVSVPFSLAGVTLHHGGASALRVRIAQTAQDTVALDATDDGGEPVVEIEAVRSRVIEQDGLAVARRAGADALYSLDWVEVAPGEAPLTASVGASGFAEVEKAVPEVVVLDVAAWATELAGEDVARAARALTTRTLASLRAFTASEPLAEARLVVVTRGAVAAGPDAPSLVQAPVAGLLRSVSAEHPGRVSLVDVDGSDASAAALDGALGSDEPELALRDGRLLAPRLVRHRCDEPPPSTGGRGGVTLITGGTGGLGALLARHLAEQGAQRLVLTSRRGAEADGASELVAELAELGCTARVVACDVADRAQVEALLEDLACELRGVVHAAGVLDDGLLDSLDEERLARVMAPKVDGALHLHELTAAVELDEFVLFSSLAATLGNAGQASYTAANAFLDALAHERRARGLPATALAWGVWEQGMAGALTASERARLERAGMRPLSAAGGLELFDLARGSDRAVLMPVELDAAALRAQARSGALPAILSSLVGVRAKRDAGGRDGALARRLAGAHESDWDAIVLDVVLGHVADTLGHHSAAAIDPERPFKELGFDSLGSVELRNRLAGATGLKLPSTLVFDHPTPVAVARYLRERVGGAELPARTRRRSATGLGEPIAIVGMSCRYPGGVTSPQELWEMLASGTDATGEFPDDRGWDVERLYDPDPDHPGTSYTRRGGFLYDAGAFDAEHFSISPREAVAIDPQQRLLLEGAWEALESAGIDPTSLRGSDTGVFCGVMYHDYAMGAGLAPAELGRLRAHQRRGERDLRAAGVLVWVGGPGGVGGHCVLVLAGSNAPGVPRAALGGVRSGAGGRRDGDGHAAGVRRVQPSAGAVGRRALQVVRGGRGWHRLVRGRRNARAGAAVGGARARSQGAGRDSWFGGESGWGEQRVDGAEWAVAGAGDSPGVGERGPVAGGCGCGGGARDGHDVGGSDRGAGADRDVWAGARGAVVDRVAEVERRPFPGGGGCRGRYQDGAGA